MTDQTDIAETYYDSDDADRFYFEIWGGEDIHIGLYRTPDEAIATASRRTVEAMATFMEGVADEPTVLDMGAGYGGAARWLVTEGGASHVACLNISETQNKLNRYKSREAGLSDRIEVRHGSFDDVPYDERHFDVVWSQDSFLHGRNRQKIIDEAARVLKPGGRLIFTDIMQTPDAPADKLQPVFDRIHLPNLGSIDFYDAAAKKAGLTVGPREELAGALPQHYSRVREELKSRRADLKGVVSDAYAERMIKGLDAWVDSGKAGWLTWGILSYDKPAE